MGTHFSPDYENDVLEFSTVPCALSSTSNTVNNAPTRAVCGCSLPFRCVPSLRKVLSPIACPRVADFYGVALIPAAGLILHGNVGGRH